ncbi:MAG: endolytic transglycosylase MltG [Holosporaceae bacterium]|nr:endolytic transglycosylase MltG [Holosporaceae bacterium]
MKSNRKNKIICFLIGFFATALSTVLFFAYRLHKGSRYEPTRNIIVEQMDDDGFSQLLIDQKISDNFIITKLSVKIMKLFKYSAKFGEYSLPRHVSLFNAIKTISSEKVVIHKITIPEGFTAVQVVRRLKKDENLLGDIEQSPQEGSILPDTYCFKYPTKRQDIISTAQKALRKFMRQEWPKRSRLCTLKNIDEVLTLASIIEKETNIEKEMVAGIYLQRLKIDMKLQSCPTAIYAHKRGESLGHALRYRELTIDDPYNTYVHKGLPPTPISNPGRSSILAVLHPLETENLFFAYEGKGKHAFSKTYEEHKRNIARIRHIDISKVL